MTVTYVVYWAITLVFIAFAIIVLLRFYQMDLTGLIQEVDSNKASLSRFQFLLFTFVVAGVWLTLCIDSGSFIDIPNGVLGLIGISGGSYVISKGIAKNGAAKKKDVA
jgi:hypothetical protein